MKAIKIFSKIIPPLCFPLRRYSTITNLQSNVASEMNSQSSVQASSDLNKEEKDELNHQRMMFEDHLKFAASQISNKTAAEDLVKLLKTAAFVDNQQISAKLLELIRHKVSTLSNEGLGSLFTSMVLIKSVDQKLIRVGEYITLRRVHSFEH